MLKFSCNRTRLHIVAALILLTGGIVSSQEPTEEASSTVDNLGEQKNRWEYYVPVPLPAASATVPETPPAGNATAPLVEFLLQPSIFTHARLDLADLRLLETGGRPVPYSLRYLRSQSDRERVMAEEFNRSEPEDGPKELTLDLKRDDIQHNEVEIETSGENFRRRIEVDGSDDGKSWRRIADGHLLRFVDGEQKINVQSIRYPDSRLRFVRVRISPDPGPLDANRSKDEFRITDVSVLRHVDIPAELLTLPAKLGRVNRSDRSGTPSSAWIIELGGDHIPCDRIEVEIADAEFARDVQVEYEVWDELRSRKMFTDVALIGQTVWQRRIGESKQPQVALFNEVQTSRLRLRVTDHRNPPLTIQSVKFSAPARQVVFASSSSGPGPLQLFFGNPQAEPPNYDFARNLPPKLIPPPLRVSLADAIVNPDFVPPPQAFTERFPWLIYVVLGSISVVLAAVIFSLSRSAIAIHDTIATDQL